MPDWSSQRRYKPVQVGEQLPSIEIPITLQRLVMEAGANRDLSLIHHDSKAAQATGAPDAYANTFFLLGMFERLVREWGGLAAQIRKLGPMQMKGFNAVGDVLRFSGEVVSKDDATQEIGLSLWARSERGRTTLSEALVVLPD